VPLAEIPAMMRALGFFPTELEIQNMVSIKPEDLIRRL
jgi:hypothetical protein